MAIKYEARDRAPFCAGYSSFGEFLKNDPVGVFTLAAALIIGVVGVGYGILLDTGVVEEST